MHRLTIQKYLAFGWLLCSGKDMHQRCLASPVFSDQSVNFTSAKIKVHSVQRQHAGELLDDAPARQTPVSQLAKSRSFRRLHCLDCPQLNGNQLEWRESIVVSHFAAADELDDGSNDKLIANRADHFRFTAFVQFRRQPVEVLGVGKIIHVDQASRISNRIAHENADFEHNPLRMDRQ